MRVPLFLLYILALAGTTSAYLTHIQGGIHGVAPYSKNVDVRGFRSPAVVFSATKKDTKTTASETFKKADFVAAVADRVGVSKKEAELSLQTVLDIIQEQVGEGKKVSLPGFGSFTPKDRAERKGRNPQTGEELVIPASKSPSFSASKIWKDSINGK